MALELSRLSRFRSSYDVLGYSLRLLSALWHRELNARLSEIDLTEMQFVILMGLGWLLEHQQTGVSQKELARSCSCSPALASQVIKSLVRKKLISVTRDRDDGRAQVIRLSKLGEERVRAAVLVTDEADAEFWGSEPKLASELSTLLKALIASKMAQTTDPTVGAMPGLTNSNQSTSAGEGRTKRRVSAGGRS